MPAISRVLHLPHRSKIDPGTNLHDKNPAEALINPHTLINEIDIPGRGWSLDFKRSLALVHHTAPRSLHFRLWLRRGQICIIGPTV